MGEHPLSSSVAITICPVMTDTVPDSGQDDRPLADSSLSDVVKQMGRLIGLCPPATRPAGHKLVGPLDLHVQPVIDVRGGLQHPARRSPTNMSGQRVRSNLNGASSNLKASAPRTNGRGSSPNADPQPTPATPAESAKCPVLRALTSHSITAKQVKIGPKAETGQGGEA